MIRYRGTTTESEDSFFNDLKKDLDLPEIYSVDNRTSPRTKKNTIIYTLYFLHILFYPLAADRTIFYSQQMNVYLLAVPTLILGGLFSIVLSIALIDLRVNQINPLTILQRKEARMFILVQYLLVLLVALVGALIFMVILNANVQIIAYNQNVNILLFIAILTALLLYVKVFNTQPISWYITEQPFWIRIEGKTTLHITSPLKLPSIRLLMWGTSVGILRIANSLGDKWFYAYIFSAPLLAYGMMYYTKHERKTTESIVQRMLQHIRKSLLLPSVHISEDIPDFQTPTTQTTFSKNYSNNQQPSRKDLLKSHFGYSKRDEPAVANMRWNPRSTAEHNIKRIWKQIESEKQQE